MRRGHPRGRTLGLGGGTDRGGSLTQLPLHPPTSAPGTISEQSDTDPASDSKAPSSRGHGGGGPGTASGANWVSSLGTPMPGARTSEMSCLTVSILLTGTLRLQEMTSVLSHPADQGMAGIPAQALWLQAVAASWLPSGGPWPPLGGDSQVAQQAVPHPNWDRARRGAQPG